MQKNWQKYLEKRFVWQGNKALAHKDVLVFIDSQGYIYVVLIVITFVAGVNYANNLILAFCFLMFALWCVSFYVVYQQLYQLEIELDTPDVRQLGNYVELSMMLRQPQCKRRYLKIKMGSQVQTIILEGRQKQANFRFMPQKRGQFYYPTIMISSVYPLGLVRAWSYIFFKKQIFTWIAPKPHFYANQSSDPILRPSLDDFRELKTYQLGDALSLIAWKQLARGQGLYTKIYEPQQQLQVNIEYNLMPALAHEDKLSLMMGLVENCHQQHLSYALTLPHYYLSVGQGYLHLQQAQRLLAEA